MPQYAPFYSGFRAPGGIAVVPAASKQGVVLAGTRVGNTYFVNEATGSDTAARAGSPQSPFATLAAALALAVDGDTIFVTGSVHTAATISVAVNNLAIIGLNAPSANDRSRISQSGSTVFTPLVNVTGQGCRFENLATFHGFADASAQICWTDSGGRNYYKNCDLLGMGDATAAAQAGSRSLLVTGGTGENLFEDCRFGLDTVLRATGANATVEFAAGSPRNIMRRCIFSSLCSLATDVHIKVGPDGIDRWLFLDDCFFIECVDSTGSALNQAISADAAAGGSVVLSPGCISVGATALATAGPVYVGQISAAGATTTGIGIHAT